MNVDMERDMLIRIKQVSAAKHYKSTAEMVRGIMKQYLKAEGVNCNNSSRNSNNRKRQFIILD